MPKRKAAIPLDELPELTDDQILAYGDKIIPMPMIRAYWREITGKDVDRSTPLQARANGRIVPIGRNRRKLYFWKSEVEAYIRTAKVGRPKQNDDN